MDPEELTPMLSQYYELCARYQDSLVLFQVGDFYETFCAAAETTARLCEITLTKREDSTGRYPMAGIPIDNAESYIETLLDAGYRVAVADQVEDPEEASGCVERAVTRVVTPGTLTETELLRGADNNFVAALAVGEADEGVTGGRTYGLALLDVSTGDFYATGLRSLDAVADEAGRFVPSEVVVGPAVEEDDVREAFPAEAMVTRYDPVAFEPEVARERVGTYFAAESDSLASEAETRACGALLAYAEYTRGGYQEGAGAVDDGEVDETGLDPSEVPPEPRLDYLNHLTRYDPREYMLLDAVAVRSLELFEPRHVHGAAGTALADVLDETASALGRRELTDWLRRPLLDTERIEARQDAVAEFLTDVRTRERLHDRLADVYDIERLVARVSRGRANARDLRSLHDTLAVVPDLREALADADCEPVRRLRDRLDPVADVREAIDAAVRGDPPPELTEGGVIREGYDDRLDELRGTEREGKRWIDDLEATERERTGVDSLKVGHNQVHGYYIEVTKANLDAVPEEYQRRQTLKNSERFVTPELKEREDEILRAEDRADDLEYELFRELRDEVAAEAERIQGLASALADLDALVALATVAAEHGYSRPEVGADRFEVEAGRHPVVERAEERFVPNGADLDPGTVAVITGPNMSGKSTYMRQVALISVLAQVGSFVPARAARLPVVDRVFTRVGASDDIAGGRSTFMVEMTEVADILRAATPRSLVLLDEVGRGTSTADGFALARAVTEYLHDEVGATVLFATHHHDLTDLAATLPDAVNRHFPATERDGEVVFRHDLQPGASTASYGVEVADAAGVPDTVVARARELLARETGGDGGADGGSGSRAASEGAASGGDGVSSADGSVSGGTAGADAPGAVSVSGDGGHDIDRLVAELDAVDLGNTTPLEALNRLSELKRLLDESG
ncbi:DNA mismatch repair protein MutS [Haloglomus litoreum]|uniref:DNA mismatch repair protein MutS n=1 Tax=Haloglomus litoreum TaxID=3034026 RepID=UPI0023E81348|nr:DNA mismatch repair protein MutS [Haloglomus sp. DT116]